MMDLFKKKEIWPAFIVGFSILILGLIGIFWPRILIWRQKAAYSGAEVQLVPASGQFTVNANFPVTIKIAARSNKVSGVDFKFLFDKDQLELSNFVPKTAFNEPLVNTIDNSTGRARFVLVNTGSNAPTGDEIEVGTMQIKGKTVSQEPYIVSIDLTTSLMVGENPATDDVALEIQGTPRGAYTIIAEVLPTLTPSPTPTGTIPPEPTATVTPTGEVTPPPDSCPGGEVGNLDCSADGVIGILDLNIMLNCWGTQYTTLESCQTVASAARRSPDIYTDVGVTILDLNKLLNCWGTVCH